MKKLITTRPDGSLKVTTVHDKPSKTKQSFADATNINKIMKRYHNDMRNIQPLNQGYYADFSNAPDYLGARQAIITAQRNFDNLPSEIRSRFQNDPAQLLSFLDDKKNTDEAIKLGLITPAELQKPNATTNDATKNPSAT